MVYSYISLSYVKNRILIVSANKKYNLKLKPTFDVTLIDKFCFHLFALLDIANNIIPSFGLHKRIQYSCIFSLLPIVLHCYSYRKFYINFMKDTRLPTILPGIDDLVLVNRDRNTVVYRFR